MHEYRSWKRRDFLSIGLASVAGVVLPGHGLGEQEATQGAGRWGQPGAARDAATTEEAAPTIRQVIDSMLADIPGAPFGTTVDTIKSGNPDQPVKGIVTTMFATDAVIEKTASLGANFIIAHEPTFYNHADETSWLDGDKVFAFKEALLEKYGIVVWRFHDHLHAHRPDGVRMGVLTALGWDKYYDTGAPELVTIPEVGLGTLIKHLKKSLGIDHLKYMGDLTRSCRRIALAPGAAGGKAQIGMIRKYQPDVLICGELNEWETSEYIRDAQHQGDKTALVVLGHSVSEEPGMEWVKSWLQPKVRGVTITHIPSGDSFLWA